MSFFTRIILPFAVALVGVLPLGVTHGLAQGSYNPVIGGVPVVCRNNLGQPVLFVADPTVMTIGQAVPAAPGRPPIIRYSSMLFNYPRGIQLFWYGHECGHHVLGHPSSMFLNPNAEAQADCWSMSQLRRQNLITLQEAQFVASSVLNMPGSAWGHLPGPARAQVMLNCYMNPQF